MTNLLFVALLGLSTCMAKATPILNSVRADLRGTDADRVALVSDSSVEFTHTDFGYGNDIWTANFSTNNMFTLSVETVAPNGNIAGGQGVNWSFFDFNWFSSPLERIVAVRLVSFIGTSFANPANLSFTNNSITFVMDGLSLSARNPVTFTSGTFQILTSSTEVEVPEPPLLSIFILGAVGLLLIRKWEGRNF